MRGLLISAFTD